MPHCPSLAGHLKGLLNKAVCGLMDNGEGAATGSKHWVLSTARPFLSPPGKGFVSDGQKEGHSGPVKNSPVSVLIPNNNLHHPRPHPPAHTCFPSSFTTMLIELCPCGYVYIFFSPTVWLIIPLGKSRPLNVYPMGWGPHLCIMYAISLLISAERENTVFSFSHIYQTRWTTFPFFSQFESCEVLWSTL